MFSSVLIANRGEIAVRILRTAKTLGLRSIAVFSDADRHALHVKLADEAHYLGPDAAGSVYLDSARILDVAHKTNADCLHPGVGFLSEDSTFAAACKAQGIVFIGPAPATIALMADKLAAKKQAERCGLQVLPAVQLDGSNDETASAQLGFPLMIKPLGGGGGKGMFRAFGEAEVPAMVNSARRSAARAFGDKRVMAERLITPARHVEVQIFGDGYGHVVHLFDRDCSVQRRHQKVIEEAPAPNLSEELRKSLQNGAVALARSVNYLGAGTVEFLLQGPSAAASAQNPSFYFLEMNTRLQIEHPVTEMITGQDLVEWQFRVAAGKGLPKQQPHLCINSHAIEARLYAEDPDDGFLPQTGTVYKLEVPKRAFIRTDTGIKNGDKVTAHYDPLLAKIIAKGETRAQARIRLQETLSNTHVFGLKTNLPHLVRILNDESFQAGTADTSLIANLTSGPSAKSKTQAICLGALHLLCRPNIVEDKAGKKLSICRTSLKNAPVPNGFQLGGRRRVSYRVRISGEVADVTLGFYDGEARVEFAGEVFEARVLLNASRHPLARFGDRVFVWHDMQQVIVEKYDFQEALLKRALLLGEEDATVRVEAPMPGQVTALFMAQGDAVEKDAVVLVIEAMKMEHQILAPIAGTVSSLPIKKGSQLQSGDLLLELTREITEVIS